MTEFKLTTEILDLTAKEFPTIPKHMIKLIYDFDRLNPNYIEEHPEILTTHFNPKIFPEDLPETTYVEGVEPQPIQAMTEEEYNKEIETLKKMELKKDLDEEKNNVSN